MVKGDGGFTEGLLLSFFCNIASLPPLKSSPDYRYCNANVFGKISNNTIYSVQGILLLYKY